VDTRDGVARARVDVLVDEGRSVGIDLEGDGRGLEGDARALEGVTVGLMGADDGVWTVGR